MDNRVCGLRIKLDTVCIMETYNMSCKLNYRKLHSEAKTEEWNVVFSCIFDGSYLTVYSSVTKSARN